MKRFLFGAIAVVAVILSVIKTTSQEVLLFSL